MNGGSKQTLKNQKCTIQIGYSACRKWRALGKAETVRAAIVNDGGARLFLKIQVMVILREVLLVAIVSGRQR